MKILAVIPARAGSKGIPNKNIRLLNGKPLISYCIENAIHSKYITDIVVTSDSEEVKLIANYYGVEFLKRSEDLCRDDVTLDAVIYNASKDSECEYIITMQPTSPTLSVVTLDNAIAYAIDQNMDTVISVVNKPHLAWVEREGKIVPDYVERLNRQYLPKHYLETGAFVISKSDVVSPNSRIGNNMGIFEITEKESIDIDSFSDFAAAEQILKQRKFAIVVNGNDSIGMGHISRMLELADMFLQKPDIFYDKNVTEESFFGGTTYNLFPYDSEEDLINKISSGKYQLLINDILDTKEQYIDRLKTIVQKVVNFEDTGSGATKADLVINALYGDVALASHILCGDKYYFMPKLFLLYKPIEIKETAKEVFVCFGGADPQGYTERIINTISENKYSKIHFTIVLGRAKRNYIELIEKYSRDNLSVYYDVKNMPELMSQCDLAITSKGRTCFELASLGIPTLAIAQNVREEHHSFVCQKNGFLEYDTGITDNEIEIAVERLLSLSQQERQKMHESMIANELKKGRERVKSVIDSL